jgi:hypothetical protein
MSIQITGNPTSAAIWRRIMRSDRGALTPEAAKSILTLDFTPEDHDRVEELSRKVQEGSLSEEERADLEEYLRVNDALTILQSKARQLLRVAQQKSS